MKAIFTNKGTFISFSGITRRRDSRYLWVRIGLCGVHGLKDRWVFMFFLFLLTLLGVIVYYTIDLVTLKIARYMYVISYACAMFCYIYTGTMNPGVIIRDENNAIENGDDLEKQGYTYCSICQLYRPPKANHCNICGVCFYKYFLILFLFNPSYDHHCGVIGYFRAESLIHSQCIAKYNLYTFYAFIMSIGITISIANWYFYNPFHTLPMMRSFFSKFIAPL